MFALIKAHACVWVIMQYQCLGLWSLFELCSVNKINCLLHSGSESKIIWLLIAHNVYMYVFEFNLWKEFPCLFFPWIPDSLYSVNIAQNLNKQFGLNACKLRYRVLNYFILVEQRQVQLSWQNLNACSNIHVIIDYCCCWSSHAN